ncbi:hypothetical protein FACS189447_08870 [Spirochaetia bacterium]|nr:hypothetical protein FACS189447_08870 [Spirochaetia bacterium]
MIQAEVVLDGGLLKSCRIHGHAGAGPKGSDIVCAAVSVLADTVFRTLSKGEGIKVQGKTPERGVCWIEVEGTSGSRGFLEAAGIFLCEGLLSVEEQYPKLCQVNIERRN